MKCESLSSAYPKIVGHRGGIQIKNRELVRSEVDEYLELSVETKT